jgi:hypothetical protein
MHTVTKPFHDHETGRLLQVGETFSTEDTTRLAELVSNGLVGKSEGKVPQTQAVPVAPSNKDAAPQRKKK